MSVSSSAKPEISSTESREMASRSCSGARATAPVSPVSYVLSPVRPDAYDPLASVGSVA